MKIVTNEGARIGGRPYKAGTVMDVTDEIGLYLIRAGDASFAPKDATVGQSKPAPAPQPPPAPKPAPAPTSASTDAAKS